MEVVDLLHVVLLVAAEELGHVSGHHERVLQLAGEGDKPELWHLSVAEVGHVSEHQEQVLQPEELGHVSAAEVSEEGEKPELGQVSAAQEVDPCRGYEAGHSSSFCSYSCLAS